LNIHSSCIFEHSFKVLQAIYVTKALGSVIPCM
jgi:hypothetical protein